MFKPVFAAATLLTLALSQAAIAGPAEEAQAHFHAIAEGKVDQLVAHYADDAVLHWVGGPLDGVYAGKPKLKEVWTQFVKGQGPLKVDASRVEVSANPKGATVTANVVFAGKSPIKVRYVLLYRGDKLVNEVWQIDPNLAAGY